MELLELIKLSYLEDIPNKDITTTNLNIEEKIGKAQLVAKEDFIFSGKEIFTECLKYMDSNIQLKWYFDDGDLVYKDQTITALQGDFIQLIQAERVALNFASHLSGIATMAHCFVKEVEHTKCKILDTRKTTPLLRDLEKQAVAHGGGTNHRRDLSDAIMLKENHIRMAGDIVKAVNNIRRNTSQPIEVETTNLTEIKEACALDIQTIMLDNMDNQTMAQAIKIIPPHIETEASGNMSVDRVKSVAELGVNYISVGSMTHSAPVADMSLLFNYKG
ncbi:MAG: carboxylating nicotinate-nucleotide diphosphorylase [Bdellovibrionaceae bacterium]|nr:carboxylating nicotinate-nucleotide diphosphorylase [Pseudobdellovibrionaceae bacterium]